MFQSKSSKETGHLLVRFNQSVNDTHAKIVKLGKIMKKIQAGECPVFPCYVDREERLSFKRKMANEKY